MLRVVLFFSLFPALGFCGQVQNLYNAIKNQDWGKAQKLAQEVLILFESDSLTDNIDERHPSNEKINGTVLYYAAIAGQSKIVESLLKAGADPNSINGKFHSTPLQSAASRGFIEITDLLLVAGSKVGTQNNIGNSIIHTVIKNTASKKTDPKILQLILARANLSDLESIGEDKLSARQLAAKYALTEVEDKVKELIAIEGIGFSSDQTRKIIFKQIVDHKDSKATFRSVDIPLSSLNTNHLIEVVNESCSKRKESNFSAKLCFEARDEMIRRGSQDFAAMSEFKKHCNDDLIRSLDFQKDQFYWIDIPKDGKWENSKIQVIPTPNGVDQKRLLVFHASVSFHGTAGGMGAFLESFIHSQEKHVNSDGQHDLEGRELNAFYEFLKLEMMGPRTQDPSKDHFPKIKFAGFVSHEVDGNMYKSSVYEVATDGIRQYLIQPDPSYSLPGGIGRGSDLVTRGRYDTYDETGRVYFSSAMAAATILYCGENKNESVQVLMAHDRNMVMLPALMRLKYNKKREEVGLKRIPTISVIHTQNGLNSSQVYDSTFTRAGLPRPRSHSIPLFTAQAVFADMTIAVSQAYASELSGTYPHGRDLGLGRMYSDLKNEQLFGGITSGIETERFSPLDKDTIGKMAIMPDFSDYSEKKVLLKKELFEAGIISSPDKPLYLYVGRFDDIKGVDTLPAFAKLIVKNGGQVVVMGPGTGAGLHPSVSQVVRMEKDPQYLGMIKVYTDFEKDQKAPLLQIGPKTKRGHLIRFASDFTFVPSVSEACGLVPIEAFAMGNGLITSYVSGLKDLCKPINVPGPKGEVYDSSNFSCVAFDRSHKDFNKTIECLNQNVESFLKFWNSCGPKEKEEHHKRWIIEAQQFAWNRPKGAMDQYNEIFRSLQAPESATQTLLRNKLIEKWVPLQK